MTDFTLTIDGGPIAVVEVDAKFGVHIRVDDGDIKTVLTDQLIEEREDIVGTADDDSVSDMRVRGIPIDDPFFLQMALLDLPRVIVPMYPEGTDIDVEGDWSIFEKEDADVGI